MSSSKAAKTPMPRRINVTMLGAGSFFTASILKDVVLIPGSAGGELRLVDVDKDRLAKSENLMNVILKASGEASKWTVKTSTDRLKMLPGTDYVVNSIEVNGMACVRPDNDIPLKYGVSQCIGDTIGPGGLFKAMRTIPVWISILKDIERVCPNAFVLNYTNPMNMMCLAGHRAVPNVKTVGLCHSVQGTSQMLAGFLGKKIEAINWDCAGINHLAWFTKFEDKGGNDMYPRLMEMAANRRSKFAIAEPVRTDMMLHFGAFITESSGHLSEYVPYYRKRKDLMRKFIKSGYRGEESFYANNWPNWRQGNDTWRDKLASGEEKVDLTRSHEYGGFIIEAIEKDAPITIHGNVSNNKALIGNLPYDGCVEVACKVDARGWTPVKYGNLPRQMAGVCDMDMRFFDVGVEACLTKNKATAVHAMLLDPLTAAVLSPSEIKSMTLEMFDAEKEQLPDFD